MLANLGKANYFRQIFMKDLDLKTTEYSINNGKFEFLQMPFSFTNAPTIFQRAVISKGDKLEKRAIFIRMI